jgi:hypothetical protein
MEGRAPGTPAQVKFAKWWTDHSAKLRDLFTEKGLRIQDFEGWREIREGGRFPNSPSDITKQRLATEPGFREWFVDEVLRQGVAKDRAEALDVLDTYTRPGVAATSPYLRPRRFVWPDELREQDVWKTIDSFHRSVFTVLAEQEQLRYFDPKTGKPRNVGASGRPQGDLGDIIADVDRRTRGGGEAALKLFEEVMGRDRAALDPKMHAANQVSSTIGAVNAIRLYGGRVTSALVQATTHPMTAALVGPDIYTKAFVKVLRNFRKVYDGVSRDIGGSGEYAHRAGLLEEGAYRTTQKIASFTSFLMSNADYFGRMVAWQAAEAYAGRLRGQLNSKNSWIRRNAQVKAEGLDLFPDQIERIKSGTMTKQDWSYFRQKVVARTQGLVTPERRIGVASGPLGRVLFQGRNFNIAAARNFWRVAGKPLFQAGNPLPAITALVGTSLIAKGAIEAGQALFGSEAKDDTLAALQRGSAVGIVGDAAVALLQGEREFKTFLERLPRSQFQGLVEELASLGYRLVDPPRERSVRLGGVSFDVDKPRIQVLAESIRRIFPNAKEWEGGAYRLFGEETPWEQEARQKEAKKYMKLMGVGR